jgi:hypothetical protein
MSFSTSAGPSPGASVTIVTTLGVTSGEASIGNATIAHPDRDENNDQDYRHQAVAERCFEQLARHRR